jgi:small GTP-binding protein
MLESILNPDQHQCLVDERRLLAEVQAALARQEVGQEHLDTLLSSVAQLDALFLLVVVGEFNAGKSALVNALLNQQVLAEGVTPTTAEIHLICHGDELRQERIDSGQELISVPVELLKQVRIVDTPGTNAIERRHEAITSDFIPRSDLVLFVTSADRPFSESERQFLEMIQSWGKKVVVVLNKVDILRRAEEIHEVTSYISEHATQLLGTTPEVFAVSALRAQQARSAGDSDALVSSGLPAVEEYLQVTLEQNQRVQLKLLNPLGVARALIDRQSEATGARLELLREDIQTIDDIERQLGGYFEDVEREFKLRLADIDNSLHEMEKRGLAFFDDTLRLMKIPELFNKERLRHRFEEQVVGEAPQEIEAKVESLIDWLVESGLNQWQAVVQHVNRRRSAHADRIVGEVGARFEYDRAGLLDSVGRSAREGLEKYDRAAEARRIADGAQRAVAGTALAEVGAVGLGATISFLASGTAADATGLITAGVLAALGLFILPNRRRKAKHEMNQKTAELRSELRETLSNHFQTEAGRSLDKIREAIAPYTRFVRTERDHLSSSQQELEELKGRIEQLSARIESATT